MSKIVLFFSILLTFLSGCQKSGPVSHQSLKINIGSDPQTLDPRMARDMNASSVVRMLFEGLTRVSKSGETELALAEKVEVSTDCTRFVFYLKRTLWSNGDPVTAQDFAASWKSSLAPEFATDLAYQLYPIRGAREAKKGEISVEEIGIRTPDDHTLIVELEYPTPYFLELLSMPIFSPIHRSALENPDWFLQPQTYVGNGPFSLQSWKHSDCLTVQKNKLYREKEEVKLELIDMVMLSTDTEIRMFEDDKLDWAGSPLSTLPIDAIRHLKNSKDLKISPLSGTYFLRVNTSETVDGKINPLSNQKFRQALAMSIDKEAIAKHILQGGQLCANTLVPPEMELKTRVASFVDSSELRKLCEEFQAEPIVLSFSGSERNASIAQALQKQWEEKLGIRVVLESIESKVYFQRVSQKNYQLAAGSWIADFNDPINFLEVFKHKLGSTNNTGWEDSKYIDLLNRSAICRESEARKELLSEAETILMEQLPILPIFHFAMNYLQTPQLEDVALSPIGQIDFRWAHLQEPLRTKR